MPWKGTGSILLSQLKTMPGLCILPEASGRAPGSPLQYHGVLAEPRLHKEKKACAG